MNSRKWPLGHRDAADAAKHVAARLSDWPGSQREFEKLLSSRLIGSTDKKDLMRRFHAAVEEFKHRLPEDRS